MATRTIPTTIIPGDNVEHGSDSRNIPNATRDVIITLVDPGDWNTQGPGTVWWGLQVSSDNGATWAKLSSNEPPGEPIGSRSPKSGGMPRQAVVGEEMARYESGICRLFFRCTAQCRVGATIELV